jgi:hypothetical protein
MPEGVRFEKYADDIIAYIIGKATLTDLPQRVADAVERLCADNRMRLNVSKSKVMHSCALEKLQAPAVKLNGLDKVGVYKYFGFISIQTLTAGSNGLR